MSENRSTHPRWIFRVALSVLQVFFALLILEVGIRVASAYSAGIRLLTYLPSISHEYEDIRTTSELLEISALGFKPGTVAAGFVLNSRGFRTAEYATEKNPESQRVLFLGDSFTFASGQLPVSLSWPVQTGRRLEARAGESTEVISLGVPSVGPNFENRVWELEARRLEPDHVILGFYVGNDFTDEQGLATEPQSTLLVHSYTARLFRNLRRLFSDSHALETFRKSKTVEFDRLGTEDPDYLQQYDPMEPSLEKDRFEEMAAGRARLYMEDGGETLDRLFQGVEPAIRQMARSIEESGADFTIVLIPDEVQVDFELLETSLIRIAPSPEKLIRPANATLDYAISPRAWSVVPGKTPGNGAGVPLFGDWDCDGRITPGIYESSTARFFITNAISHAMNSADAGFVKAEGIPFGNIGDQPLVGDWNGDGCDTFGVYRPASARFYYANALTGPEKQGNPLVETPSGVTLGAAGDVLLAGDWDGKNGDTIAIYRPSTARFYFTNSLPGSDGGLGSPPEFVNPTGMPFGAVGDQPVAGDWDGDGIDAVGVYRPETKRFYFAGSVSNGSRGGAVLNPTGTPRLDLRGPQRRVLELCRELEIRCIDLLPVFQHHARQEKLYRLQDTHWNPRGNQLAADAIERAVRENR